MLLSWTSHLRWLALSALLLLSGLLCHEKLWGGEVIHEKPVLFALIFSIKRTSLQENCIYGVYSTVCVCVCVDRFYVGFILISKLLLYNTVILGRKYMEICFHFFWAGVKTLLGFQLPTLLDFY